MVKLAGQLPRYAGVFRGGVADFKPFPRPRDVFARLFPHTPSEDSSVMSVTSRASCQVVPLILSSPHVLGLRRTGAMASAIGIAA
jgi:hypothetical protein